MAAALCRFGEQREVETLDRLATLNRQLGADAALVLQTRDFVTAGAAEMPNPFLAFGLEIGVVHEGRRWIRGRLLPFQSDEIGGDVFRVLRGETKTWHHRHVLHLQFVTVVWTAAVLQIKNKR